MPHKSKTEIFTREANIDIGKAKPVDFLKSLNLATASGITNAGALFFVENPGRCMPHARLTLLAFKGKNKLVIYDRKDVQDDLLTQFNDAITFLMKHLNVRSEIHGVNRKDIYEIPIEALREAVVNALMHRDYSITGTQIQIEIYENRVDIISPGGLPKKLPREKFGTMSVHRNELIADMFSRLGKVERVGSGINKMKEMARASGLREPTFEENGLFKATFYRPDIAVTETTQKILLAIRDNPKRTRKELAAEVGISEDGVKYHLKKMVEKGLLRRIGPDRGGHWEVADLD